MNIIKDKIKDKWFRMDNSAVIYPISITPTSQSLFRLTAEMHEYIDEELLKIALKNILPRFPTFAVQLRSGLFRHYFDQNDLTPIVAADNGNLFQKINFSANNRYLFRVTYFKKKIFVDFFHALCDGYGALEFMKSFIYQYTVETGQNPIADDSIKTITQSTPIAEQDDSFLTYHKKYKLFGGAITNLAGTTALQIKGKRFKKTGYGVIEARINSPALLSLAKKYNCSMTVLIAANALLSIAEVHAKDTQTDNIVAMIPVNLRKLFPSQTLKNFTSLIRCQINPNTTPRSLQAYCDIVKKQLTDGLDPDALSEKLSLSAFMGVKWYMKIMPLFIKAFFIKMGKWLSLKTTQTLIVSNIGIANMPSGMDKLVKNISFNSNVSKKVPINMGVISFNDTTTISFTRSLVSTDIERRFIKRLATEGLDIDVVSNLREINKDLLG